jgi:hypothetical protein
MTDIKLIALDLDGTLLSSDNSISRRNRAAISRATQLGVHVVLASGRMYSSILNIALDLGLPDSSPVLACNGALGRTVGGDLLFEERVPADVAMQVVEFCRKRGKHVNYYLDDVLYTANADKWVEFYYGRTQCLAKVVGDLSCFDGRRPTKMIVIDDKDSEDRLMPEIVALLGAGATVVRTDDVYIEIMAAGVDKGFGLAAVAKALELDRSQCAAMGDGYNDLEMLQWAGRGIAMANARPEVLDQVAEHAFAVDEDGVGIAIESMLAPQGAARDSAWRADERDGAADRTVCA